MPDKVKPLKIENPVDGTQDDQGYPTQTNPLEDYIAAKGIAFENSDNYLIHIVDNEITFLDPVNNIKKLSDLASGGGNLNSGTAKGQMLFWNDSLNIWDYTETTELFWDDTNKRLGVGIANPSVQLEVSGNGLVALFGNDPGAIALGSFGIDKSNAFAGGYYDAGSSVSTSYLGQNIYYDGLIWNVPDTGKKTALHWMQKGVHYFNSGVNDIGSTKLKIESTESTFYHTVKLSDAANMGVSDGSLATKKYVDDKVSGASSGISESEHRELNQLVHNIAEASYYEVTYNTTHTWRIDTVIWWNNSSKTEKIRELTYTYDTSQIWKKTVETWKQYNSGVLVETLTGTYTWNGIFINNIEWVLI